MIVALGRSVGCCTMYTLHTDTRACGINPARRIVEFVGYATQTGVSRHPRDLSKQDHPRPAGSRSVQLVARISKALPCPRAPHTCPQAYRDDSCMWEYPINKSCDYGRTSISVRPTRMCLVRQVSNTAWSKLEHRESKVSLVT
jgi:hypothetical protein